MYAFFDTNMIRSRNRSLSIKGVFVYFTEFTCIASLHSISYSPFRSVLKTTARQLCVSRMLTTVRQSHLKHNHAVACFMLSQHDHTHNSIVIDFKKCIVKIESNCFNERRLAQHKHESKGISLGPRPIWMSIALSSMLSVNSFFSDISTYHSIGLLHSISIS